MLWVYVYFWLFGLRKKYWKNALASSYLWCPTKSIRILQIWSLVQRNVGVSASFWDTHMEVWAILQWSQNLPGVLCVAHLDFRNARPADISALVTRRCQRCATGPRVRDNSHGLDDGRQWCDLGRSHRDRRRLLLWRFELDMFCWVQGGKGDFERLWDDVWTILVSWCFLTRLFDWCYFLLMRRRMWGGRRFRGKVDDNVMQMVHVSLVNRLMVLLIAIDNKAIDNKHQARKQIYQLGMESDENPDIYF